jgi:hypothetical protein
VATLVKPRSRLRSGTSRQVYAACSQNSLDYGYTLFHSHMLALDHPLNFIEYLDCTFIVGDKQGLQDCFKIINSLYPSAGLKGPVASNLGDEMVNDVSFLFFGHAPKHYSI